MMRMSNAQQMADLNSRKNYSGTLESVLWRNAGPSAYQLQQNVENSQFSVYIHCFFRVMPMLLVQ